METVVYVDVLLILNYVITALLVEASAKLLGRVAGRRRLVIASLLGALCALTIFLPANGFWFMMALRLLSSWVIVLAAFGGKGAGLTLKAWAMFIAVSFFFAGVMLGIWMLFAPRGMIYHNGILYYNLNPVTLLVCTVAAYLILGVFRRFSRGSRLPGLFCKVVLELQGRTVLLDALIDSGNGLYEPFSGTPVIVVALPAVRSLLPTSLYRALEKSDWEEAAKKAGVRIRLVPYQGVGGEGTLPAIKLDGLKAEQNGKVYHVEQVYMAVSDSSIGHDGAKAILSPDLAGVSVSVHYQFDRKV